MEDNNRQAVNPSCWVLYIFTAVMWMFSMIYLNVLQGDYYLICGLILLVSLPFWIKAANQYYQNGDVVMGHFYMVCGVLFGGFIAVVYLALYLGHIFPTLVMDERIMGMLYLTGGLFFLPTVPSFLYMDKVNLVTWTVCAIWLIEGGIAYFFPDIIILYQIGMICCITITAGVTYMMLNEARMMCLGKGLPMGKPVKGD